MKEVLGAALILLPFISLFIAICVEDGIGAALSTFGAAALLFGTIVLGAWLLSGR